MESLQMENDRCKDLLNDASNIESWKEEVEMKNKLIVYLKQQLKRCESLEEDANWYHRMSKDIDIQYTRDYKNSCNPDVRILTPEKQVTPLRNSSKSDNAKSRMESSEKDRNEKMNREADDLWKQEIKASNRRIKIEQAVESLDSFLQENTDTQKIRNLEKTINKQRKQIEEFEDTVEELEGFLTESTKEIRDLHSQMSLDKERIKVLETWIQRNSLANVEINKARIMELEEIVTNLENYVKEHDIYGLKRKLQDREYRIDQLEKKVVKLDQKLSRFNENQPDTSEMSILDDRITDPKEREPKVQNVSKEVNKTQECRSQIAEEQDEILKMKLREKDQKIKEMGHDISEKDNKIQEYEQQIIEHQNKILQMENIAIIVEALNAADVSVLQEKIKVHNGKVQELKTEVDSLETLFGKDINEELVNALKEKEKIVLELENDLAYMERKIEELNEAIHQNFEIMDKTERMLKHEKKLRKEAERRIIELEEKIVVMYTVSPTKCTKPLLQETCKTEEKLLQMNQQIEREVLRATLSEKDASLAQLEHSGITTPTQADRAEKLKMEKKMLLDKLREEDEKSIKFKLETTPQLFKKVLDISDDKGYSDNKKNSFFYNRKITSSRPASINNDNSSTSTTSIE